VDYGTSKGAKEKRTKQSSKEYQTREVNPIFIDLLSLRTFCFEYYFG